MQLGKQAGLKAGDVVGVREKSKSLQVIADSLSANSAVYEWISWNSDKKEGTFVTINITILMTVVLSSPHLYKKTCCPVAVPMNKYG